MTLREEVQAILKKKNYTKNEVKNKESHRKAIYKGKEKDLND